MGLFITGINPRGEWATAMDYEPGDVVVMAVALIEH